MIKTTISAVILFLFLTGCATATGVQTGVQDAGKPSGTSVPVITASFASKTLVPGDTWKVYIKASDPDGEMKYVFASVYQAGRGDYPASRTRIAQENAKELNGYVYLNTLVPGGYEFLYFVTVTLTVNIQDSAGHYSREAVFPLSFAGTYEQEPPPPGVFKEQNLGPILVTLRPFDTDGHGDGFF
jgi:hypothetical protein